MKLITLLGLGLLPFAAAQSSTSLGPAPTESYGCEPHGDHYHCEGAVSETATSSATPVSSSVSATATSEHDHDHDHDDGETSGTLAPSPTESTGCEPHGDHWHCDAAVSETATSDSTLTETSTGAAVSGTSETTADPTSATATETSTDAAVSETSETTADSTPTESPTGAAVANMIPLVGAVVAAVVAF
ncbi:hypothetical protein GMORB2_7649 [Geosmithia morbida]|uniref:Uncharacterized protein n=1 Tax=Geosmithia morbida TaxID=1094350 RepID=A0A9P5D314_9HYPO|nr:uncharacterized protein GMORB2_7649 [Geosmithia morbida]KAF4122056.1 hypothetical protein GMORB2_7649 [Geosmithia morbida]